MRLKHVAAVLGVAAMLPLATASASDSDLTSDQVATEILRVQGLADRAAERWAEAQRRAEDLEVELASSERSLVATEAKHAQLEAGLTQIAIDRFTGSAGSQLRVLFGDPSDEMQMEVLLDVAFEVGAANLDLVDSVRSDLDDARRRVAELREQNNRLVQELAASQIEIEQQLLSLEQLLTHLEDEEVKRAYEEQLTLRRQEKAENPVDADAAALAAPQEGPLAKGGGPAAPPASSVTVPPSEAEQLVAPSEPTPTPTTTPAASPAPAPPPVVAQNGWVCPVAGPTAFGDTWGAARSGGRSHEGVDMMSPRGTPVVAVVAGSVTMKTNTLGGNAIWLTSVDGAKYYYAHLSAWEGGSRGVAAGETIGYVGATGNTTANHLHFEIHPGGGAAINPYPTVRQYC